MKTLSRRDMPNTHSKIAFCIGEAIGAVILLFILLFLVMIVVETIRFIF